MLKWWKEKTTTNVIKKNKKKTINKNKIPIIYINAKKVKEKEN